MRCGTATMTLGTWVRAREGKGGAHFVDDPGVVCWMVCRELYGYGASMARSVVTPPALPLTSYLDLPR